MSKQGYHHGNLRQALVASALELIEEKGPTGFTLSEAAKRAGVTPAAVYRHFEGREDLIAECARQGYLIFGDLLDHAWNGGKPSALAAFSAVGRAYLAFARKYPGHYMAMFESGISPNRSPDLAAVARKSSDAMERATRALMAHMPPEKRPPVAMVAAHVWAMSHGVVELYSREGNRAPYAPEDLLESGIGVYLRGLGLIAPD
ncbi:MULTISPECIES: TetR/AcrR family transcriptional regulator [Thioclava]|uniref:TetR family transcriptional regulator n=1 Tax=Thioclava nitratireducens TaxID=1915078 RepID=A0ABM6IHD0_9RHOB|nr:MULTISPECIES: TetR/AcrR family transcriptional regulator [Thioclava]AQS48110.1 TetR family transcriptional regulator [Thioclava nitratireducens]OWY05149.1 TetR family transcriptional regulator [Thioclava sp. F1Mire-8]OWY06795.1 TetR family transcriptional regulator [Thioclava sp. IC9]OWY08972.1 TetR family transcriptional regulator [Thioclava sp. F42-5]OWY15526.1 TetR family transcriptional regulator [Thioclava sp. F34-6]